MTEKGIEFGPMERALMALYRRAGAFWVVAAVTAVSILLSVLATLTLVVPQLSPGHLDGASLLTAVAISVVVPLLVAPPSVWLVLSLLVRLDEAYEKVLRLSTTDQLTGASNRRGFFAAAVSRLAGACSEEPVLVGMLDLDRFKQLNDRHGHRFGDAVLRTLAETLHGAVQGRGAVGRLGGDEFAFFCAAPRPELEKLQDRLRQDCAALRLPADVGGPIGGVSASIGMVWLEHGEQLDQGLARADELLYEQKARGGSSAAPGNRRYRSGRDERSDTAASVAPPASAGRTPATLRALREQAGTLTDKSVAMQGSDL